MLFDGCFQICKGAQSKGTKARGSLLARLGVADLFSPPPIPVTLLQADFCPFANRAEIALLEKEKDPYNPVLFEKVHVCFVLGPEKDQGTGWLYSLGFKTVPTMIDNTKDGEAMDESMDIVEKVDEKFSNNSLKPKGKEAQEHMKAMLEKHSAVIPTMYKLMLEQSSEKQKSLAKTLLKQVSDMNTDLKKNTKGPYLCGEEFTMADIALFPFYERIIIVLGHYHGFVIPEELSHVHNWYKATKERPSVKITTSDRDEESMNTYCFEEQERAKYLVECYEAYANNELDLRKQIGRESSSPGVNSYREYKRTQAAEQANVLNDLVKNLS